MAANNKHEHKGTGAATQFAYKFTAHPSKANVDEPAKGPDDHWLVILRDSVCGSEVVCIGPRVVPNDFYEGSLRGH